MLPHRARARCVTARLQTAFPEAVHLFHGMLQVLALLEIPFNDNYIARSKWASANLTGSLSLLQTLLLTQSASN